MCGRLATSRIADRLLRRPHAPKGRRCLCHQGLVLRTGPFLLRIGRVCSTKWPHLPPGRAQVCRRGPPNPRPPSHTVLLCCRRRTSNVAIACRQSEPTAARSPDPTEHEMVGKKSPTGFASPSASTRAGVHPRSLWAHMAAARATAAYPEPPLTALAMQVLAALHAPAPCARCPYAEPA